MENSSDPPAGTLEPRAFAPALPRSFYDRPTSRVARELLGKRIARRAGRSFVSVSIVETEAYVAHDPSSHAYRGRTARNASMFGAPGTLYVFRIHQVVCANVVTRPGEAVLLRAGAPEPSTAGNPSGPGRLSRHLGITLRDDGADLVTSKIRILGGPPPVGRISTGPRVGISRARERPLRFLVWGNRWVSSPRPWGRRMGPT